jgi:beta-galactosidase
MPHRIVDSRSGKTEWNGIVFANDGMSDHWNRTPGEKLSLYVYTNADRVELFEKGKKIATKPNTTDASTRNQIRSTASPICRGI